MYNIVIVVVCAMVLTTLSFVHENFQKCRGINVTLSAVSELPVLAACSVTASNATPACLVTVVEALHELSMLPVCSVLATEAVLELSVLPVCSIPATEAVPGLSVFPVCSITNIESIPELCNARELSEKGKQDPNAGQYKKLNKITKHKERKGKRNRTKLKKCHEKDKN